LRRPEKVKENTINEIKEGKLDPPKAMREVTKREKGFTVHSFQG